MNLQNLIKNKSMNLRPTKTVITDNLGRRYEVENGIKKELTRGLPFVIDEKPDMQISCIIHGLFLSSQDPAVDIEILKKYNIKHILSIGINLSLKFDGIKYYQCELLDLPESDIFLSVKTCINIIHKNRHENILIHCNAGVSRSPTIVISYLMTLENMSYDEAYEKVKSKRNCIKPNSGFVEQLKALNVSNLIERD
ncbi:PREDICTED: dual specificity protein phosphatase 19 [Polistes dominula]|uniref:Dual specificity protein phosphatase 19 n=1 Tax=Polistes dominula TaxID=743375 RepID=A0ABM1J1E0_POLDO|nr:PREDICTED: dual specificity protein phosphatase 19 [Polistes dominula]